MSRLVKKWNPYLTFTCTISEIREWVDRYGPTGFYDGASWRLVSRRIVPGRYEVRFEKT